MSVLIKGMEMPSIGTYEASIDVTNINGKTAISVYLRDKNDSRRFSVGVYEAIHVPPHGRLIEKKAVFELIQSVPSVDKLLPVEFMKALYKIPTVIEAEEGDS